MDSEDFKIKLARELGGINEKLNFLVDSHKECSEHHEKLSHRVTKLESEIGRILAVASFATVIGSLLGWIISNWNKIGKMFS